MARPVTHDATLRSALLAAAAAMIDRDGPERFSVREVALAADTSTSAVYSLFGGKAELFAAVVDDAFAPVGRARREAEPHGLRALGVAYRAWALAHPDRYRLMFSGTVDPRGGAAEPPSARTALLPLIRTLTGSAEIDSETDLRDTIAVWAQVHGAVSLELSRVCPPVVDADAVYETVLDAILAVHPGR